MAEAELVAIELPDALLDASQACRAAFPALRAKYGAELEYAKVSGLEYVYTGPSEKEWERFQDTIKDQRTHAMKALVLSCVKYPAVDELRAALARKPGSVSILANMIGILAGVDQEAQAKKL